MRFCWPGLLIAILLPGAGPVALADPVSAADEFVGAKSCGGCHAVQAASHAGTGHARSLHRGQAHPLLSAMLPTGWLLRSPDFRFRFQLLDAQLRVQAHDGKDVMDIPVDWAFGAGDQAVTFVSRINQDWYLEHSFSYYAATRRMETTAGHGVLQPKSLADAMGVPYKTSDPQSGIEGCFACHSTGPLRLDAETGWQPLEQGVQCESCHGAGRAHIAAANKGDRKAAKQLVRNPRRLPAAAINTACGRCHRPPGEAGTSIDWNYSWNVRHQPVYLSQSKCMKKGDGTLSCFTCHEPHQPLQKSAGFYNQRCLGCHSRDGSRPAAVCRTENSSNCVDCHMPRVSPQSSLRFTNHWIGVFDGGSKLKPRE